MGKLRNRRQEQQRRQLIFLAAVLLITLIITIGIIISLIAGASKEPQGTETGASSVSTEEAKKEAERKALIDEADYLALTYDYDAAIAKIQTWEDYDIDDELLDKITEYEIAKSSCVKVDISKVTHIFYHSLVVDPERAFDPSDYQGRGNNEWMTTISEFNKITQEMYDRGYVLVSIHDLYTVTTDENGNEVMKQGEIYLPEGKKAFVLSLDDLSYYHSYDGYGFASKLYVDENGDLMNEYIDADGNVLYGAYDCVPLLDKFIEEHPDASYRGAKGTVALTGYNGIFGYRTDESYSFDNINNPNYKLDKNKQEWLLAHPDFNLEEERAAAKEVADVMKAKGWTFASHTWGHLSVGNKSVATLQADNEKWQRNVASIVGETNVIIFAHGQDLGDWGDYKETNDKFNYYKSQGFNVFCNVDGSEKYLVWFGDNYLRQGRRNLDGIRMWYNLTGKQDNLSDLFDVEKIVDPLRPGMDVYD